VTVHTREGVWRSIGLSLLECTSQRRRMNEHREGGGIEVLKESLSPIFQPSIYVSEVFSRNDDFFGRKRPNGHRNRCSNHGWPTEWNGVSIAGS
jgi:hypothetical protein